MNSRPKSEDPVDLISDRLGWVCSDGYEWVVGKVAVRRGPGPSESADELFLLPRSFRGHTAPVSNEAYLEFAATETSVESMLGFANCHGLLGLQKEHFHSGDTTVQYGESITGWASAIHEYQQAFKVWSFIEAKDGRGLKHFLQSDGEAQVLYRLDEDHQALKATRSAVDAALCRLVQHVNLKLGSHQRTFSKRFDCFIPGCEKNTMVVRVPGTVSYGLKCSFRRGQAKAEAQIVPANLIAAIWLQFSQLISGERTKRSCEVCRKLMDVSESARPRSKRMHDRCSLAQRMRRYRAKISGNNEEAKSDGQREEKKTRKR